MHREINTLLLSFSEAKDEKTDKQNINKPRKEIPDLPTAAHVKRLGKQNSQRVRPVKLYFNSVDKAKVIFKQKVSFVKKKLRDKLKLRLEKGEQDLTNKFLSGKPQIVTQKKGNTGI